VLQGYLHNAASAAQLGEALTGHAGRSFGAATGISTSNLDLRPGTLSLEALMADIDHGLFIEGMFGPSINQGTGDFSIGVHGRMIVKGKLDHAFSEATVAGNLLDILPSLTAADDFQRRGATNSPSLRLDAVTIAGR
jgi:PmbA protein